MFFSRIITHYHTILKCLYFVCQDEKQSSLIYTLPKVLTNEKLNNLSLPWGFITGKQGMWVPSCLKEAFPLTRKSFFCLLGQHPQTLLSAQFLLRLRALRALEIINIHFRTCDGRDDGDGDWNTWTTSHLIVTTVTIVTVPSRLALVQCAFRHGFCCFYSKFRTHQTACQHWYSTLQLGH